ncbi:hypothetical protein LSAT2_010831 [Lamellibrachia satsuma]|nr:hypothetical protein LSAT2_010831 [Lamellibrachia satsuma]
MRSGVCNLQVYDQAEARMQKLQHNIDNMKAEERDILLKVAALKRLREVKVSSDTMKKIFYYGYIPGEITKTTDELEEAFKITAAEMGKDWMKLYQQLPFVPARDQMQRTRDLEVIDRNSRRMRSCGFRMLTTKCLEKWRRLSEEATLFDLLTTLKTIRKQDTIRKILRRVVTY